jgi:hypothetical protein
MIKINDIPYLTIEDYAKEKQKSIQTIYNWIKDKKVESRKFMGQQLIKL